MIAHDIDIEIERKKENTKMNEIEKFYISYAKQNTPYNIYVNKLKIKI